MDVVSNIKIKCHLFLHQTVNSNLTHHDSTEINHPETNTLSKFPIATVNNNNNLTTKVTTNNLKYV